MEIKEEFCEKDFRKEALGFWDSYLSKEGQWSSGDPNVYHLKLGNK